MKPPKTPNADHGRLNCRSKRSDSFQQIRSLKCIPPTGTWRIQQVYQNIRYKHLLFGVNAASELFQKAISDLLRGIPGVKNLSEDIIIYGRDQISHDSNLGPTLERLQNAGARLNREKFIFSVRELTFFGHIFSENLIQRRSLQQ